MNKSKYDKQAEKIMQEVKEVQREVENQEDFLPSLNVLTPLHQRFVHMYLSGKFNTAKLAEIFDVHPNTILKWLKRTDIQVAITEVQSITNAVVTQQLSNMANKAVVRLNDLMDSPNDMVALMSVRDVLDRSGHKPKNEIKIDKTVRTYEQKISDLVDMTIESEEVDYEVVDE